MRVAFSVKCEGDGTDDKKKGVMTTFIDDKVRGLGLGFNTHTHTHTPH